MVIRRRPLAADDIAEIWDPIADDSLRAADRWIDQLDEQFALLASQPLMGRARDELAPGLRSFPFGRYVILYEPIEGGIDIVRLLHSARDVDAQFGDPGASPGGQAEGPVQRKRSRWSVSPFVISMTVSSAFSISAKLAWPWSFVSKVESRRLIIGQTLVLWTRASPLFVVDWSLDARLWRRRRWQNSEQG